MTISIRAERPEDFPIIHELVRLAFIDAECVDGDEHFLVDRLRLTPDYIPELTMVAEEDSPSGPRIVGHIMFTKLKVGDSTVLALAPLAVLPGYQRKGIGGALVRRGHELAREMGWEYSVVLGHVAYYPRFGYKPASSFGVISPFDVPDEAFMAMCLTDSPSGTLSGMVQYSLAFFQE